MHEHIRVGIIGTSPWAEFMYYSSTAHHPYATITAICGRNQVRLQELATKYAIPHTFVDYHAMIVSGVIDAVIIVSPDHEHHPMTMAALTHGIHVLCDKPLAANTTLASEMESAAHTAGVVNMVTFTYTWMPHYVHIRDMITAGILGDIQHYVVQFNSGYARDGAYQWRLDPRYGNGVLGDLTSHAISLARLFVGEITSVSAQLDAHTTRIDPHGTPVASNNESAQLLVTNSNGASGYLQSNLIAHMASRNMSINIQLYGSKGSIESRFNLFGPDAGVVSYLMSDADVDPVRIELPMHYLCGEATMDITTHYTKHAGVPSFIDAVRTNTPSSPSFYDGRKVQEVIDAALASHTTGARIHII
jgi:predicted dehydrogenase